MAIALQSLFFLTLPVIGAAVVLMAWAFLTQSARFERVLLLYTRWVGATLIGLSVLLSVTMGTCRGDVLYGFRECTLFPDTLAGIITAANFGAFILALLSFALLILVGLGVEIHAWRQGNRAR